MTIGTTDGKSVWAFRYSSERKSRSLFYSTDVRTVRKLYREGQRLQEVSVEREIVVSEPLGDLPGVWHEVPAGTALVVQPGDDHDVSFTPRDPA